MFRSTRVEIHLHRAVHNARILRDMAGPGAFFCPMVKARAYGHGDVEIAKALWGAGFPRVGVALVEEGVTLRQGGFQGEILVFGPLSSSSLTALDEFRLVPVVGRWEDWEILRHGPARSIHLKFNTGMHRLGFPASDASRLRESLSNGPLALAGVCTHLSHGHDAALAEGFSQRQLRALSEILRSFPGVTCHALNSSGLISLLNIPASERARWGARPGISLYGLQDESASALEPVLEWKTQIVVTQKVAKGHGVSYGGTWIAPSDAIVGIVPLGYADGYMRILSNKSEMLFRGQRVPVVGRVCMDYTLLDLTNALRQGGSGVGEEVVVIGAQGSERITARELADLAQTISYEIATNISGRVPRRFLEAP